jgi:hypothetical protein
LINLPKKLGPIKIKSFPYTLLTSKKRENIGRIVRFELIKTRQSPYDKIFPK